MSVPHIVILGAGAAGTAAARVLAGREDVTVTPEKAMRMGRVTEPSRRHRPTGPVRAMLWRTGPAIAAGWATNGLFLALGSTLVRDAFDASSHIQQASTMLTLAAAGIISALALYRRSAITILRFGTTSLASGAALSVVALSLGVFPLYLAAVVVVGAGFGTTFMGTLRAILPLTGQSQRARTFAIVYVVSYLAFAVPAIAAGLLAPELTVAGAMNAIVTVVAVAASIAAIFAWRLHTGSLAGNTPTPYPVLQGRLRSDDQVKEPHR